MTLRRMPGKVRWKLLVAIVVGVVVLAAAALVARQVRRQILADRALAAAKEALAQKDWAKAHKHLHEYLTRKPEDVPMLRQYATANLILRPVEPQNILGAIDAYRRIMRHDAEDTTVFHPLAVLYAYAANAGELAYVTDIWCGRAPESLEARLWRAKALVAQGKPDAARQAREVLAGSDDGASPGLLQAAAADASRKHPQYVDACAMLADLALQSNAATRRVDALTRLDQAVAYDPDSPHARCYRAALALAVPTNAGQTVSETLDERRARMGAARKDLDAATAFVGAAKDVDPALRLTLARQWLGLGSGLKAAAVGLRGVARRSTGAAKTDAENAAGKADADADVALGHAAAQLGAVAEGIKALDAPDEDMVLKHDVVDPRDIRTALFMAQAELADRRGTPTDAVALADEALAAIDDRPHRFVILPAIIDMFAWGGREGDAAKARACLTEFMEMAQSRQPPIAMEQAAYLKCIVSRAEGNPREIIAAAASVSADSQHPLAARLWRMLADAYRQTGQPQRAAQMLTRYAALRPSDPQVALGRARGVGSLSAWESALVAARQAEDAAPGDVGVAITRIEAEARVASMHRSGPDKARLTLLARELADLRKAQPQRVDIRLRQAMLADLLGKPDGAEAELKAAVAECPAADTMEAELTLARFYAEKQRTGDAVAVARQACVRHAARPEPHVLLGQLLATDGKRPEALQTLQEALKSLDDPQAVRDVTVVLALLEMSDASGRKSGIDRLKALAAKSKDDTQVRSLLLGMPDVLADVAYAQSLVEDIRTVQGADSLIVQLQQARLWLAGPGWRERQRDIVDALGRCIAADETWVEAALVLGRAHERAGDLNQAEAVYRRALGANPGAVAAADRLLALLERRGRFTDARDVLNRMADNPALRAGHVWRVAYGEGNAAVAIEELQKVAAQPPGDADALLNLARIVYLEKKDVAQALKYLDEAAAKMPESQAPTAIRVAILEREGRRAEARQIVAAAVQTADSFATCLLSAEYLDTIGDRDAAEKEYIRLTNFSSGGAGHMRLAQFYLAANRPDERIRVLEEGLKAHPASVAIKDALMRSLLDRNAGTDRQRAEQMLADLEKGSPANPSLMGVRALMLANQGTAAGLRKAEEMLKEVVRLNPSMVDAHAAQCRIAVARDDPAAARDAAVRALEANPTEYGFTLTRAEAEAALGNVGTARDLVLALLRARPDDIAVLSALAALAVRGNPVDAAALTEARTRTEAALRARPNDLRLNLLMARVLVAGGARKAAIERLDAFRKTEAGGAGVDVPLALADLCRQEGDARSAALVDEAARIAPEDLRVLAGLAAEGKFDQVQRTAEAWRGQASKSGLLLTAAGILAAGDQPAPRKAAVDLYQEVTALVPASLPANLGLALASYQMGDADRAEKGYRKVLELDPENVRALNDLAWLLTESRQKHKEALDLADRGVLLAPRNSYLRDTRGVIFMRLGRMAEAQRDLEQCVALRSADPAGHARALLKLGRICHELNDPAATRRNLEQALQIDKEAQVLTPEDRQEIAQLLAAGSGGR